MSSSRTVRDARRESHAAIVAAHAPTDVEEDVGRVIPEWIDVLDLVEGARQRGGWTEAQLDYLRAVIGVTWAKAYRRGQAAQ